MTRPKLTLKKQPTPPPDDPAKRELAERLGFRYVMRSDGRYMAQALVFFEPNDGRLPEKSWFDIPLVPETPYA